MPTLTDNQPNAASEPLLLNATDLKSSLKDKVAQVQLLRVGTREYEREMRFVCDYLSTMPNPKNHYGLSTFQYIDSYDDIHQEIYFKFILEIHKQENGKPTFKPINVENFFSVVQAKNYSIFSYRRKGGDLRQGAKVASSLLSLPKMS